MARSHLFPTILLIAATICLCSALNASADALLMENGDHLTGSLAHIRAGSISFTTPYAGIIDIAQGAVKALTTVEPVAVEFADGVKATGRLVVQDGAQAFKSDEAVQIVTVSEIVSVGPAEQQGQTPEEQAEAAKKWSGALQAGSALRSGTTDTLDANTALTFVRKWPDNVLTIDLGGSYGEVDSEQNTRRASGEVKWQYYPRERIYLFGLAGAEHDAGKKLDLRARTAAGIGKDFIKTERRNLSIDIGVGYTKEWWKQYDLIGERKAKTAAHDATRARLLTMLGGLQAATDLRAVTSAVFSGVGDMKRLSFNNDTHIEDSVSLRLSSHFDQALFTQSRISEDLTFEPDLGNPGAFRVLSDLAFTTPLSERMNLRIDLKTEYDSEPGRDDTDEWDNTLLTSLQYEF